MSSPAADQWSIVAYEVRMLRATYEIVLNSGELQKLSKVVQNALEESAVLHTRILCDIFLSNSGGGDDIILSRLMPDWQRRNKTEYDTLKELVARLRTQYGNANNANSHCWVFNKMMAHPTRHRGVTYDYTSILTDLRSILEEIITEIESLRRQPFKWAW